MGDAAADLTALRHAEAAYEGLVALARDDCALFCELVLADEETGTPIEMTPMHLQWHRAASSGRNMVIWAFPESGKAVPLDTEIPTPRGWTTMGALQVGDEVFGRDGKPCTVNWVSPVQHGRTVYRVTFSDGTSALADADHQWAVWRQHDRRKFQRSLRTVTTEHMRTRLIYNGKRDWHVPLCGAAQYPAQVLPVDPYVLGCWLGDGDAQGPQFTCHEDDAEVLDRCVAAEGGVRGKGKRCGLDGKVMHLGIGVSVSTKRRSDALSDRLKGLGVVNNKHIPDTYMRGSEQQRRELLAGLLDTDGYVDGHGDCSRVEFGNSNHRLALQCAELARSLGYRVTVRGPLPSKIRGQVVGQHWRVAFTARDPVFKLRRKLACQKLDGDRTRTDSKVIVAIEEVPSVPVKCIGVDSVDHTYLMGRDYTVTHNSQQFSIGRVLWLLGKNPRLRIAILAAAERQVKKIIQSLRRHIENNQVLHKIFPDLRRGDLWTDSALSVARPGIIKDPSVQAVSPNGAIQGARVNVLIIDDVLVEENTRTAYQRDKIATWIRVSAFSRLSKKSQVIMLANAFHPDDFAHQLARLGWWAKKYPVLDEAGQPTYPQRWPIDRIERVRTEELGPTEFARMMLCQARADEEARFQSAWIDACKLRGVGYPMPATLRALVAWVGSKYWLARGISWVMRKGKLRLPQGFHVVTGVDLGVSQRDAADPSVLFTILVWPDGTRQVLSIRRGRWQGPSIIKNVVEVWEAFGGVFLVENNAAQDYLRQWLAEDYPEITVKAFRTGKNKRDVAYGVESIAGELEDELWLIPSDEDGHVHPNVHVWIQEMLYYSPDGHTGDCLMAAWIAREGARAVGVLRKHRTATVRVIGGANNVAVADPLDDKDLRRVGARPIELSA